MDITKLLFTLCSLTQIGGITECTEYIKDALKGKADGKLIGKIVSEYF